MQDNQPPFVLASLWTRFAGNFIDSLIIGIVLIPIVYFSGGFDMMMSQEAVEPTLAQNVGAAIAGLAVYAVVNWKSLEQNGQTIGKRIMGTKIVFMDGTQAGAADVVLKRYAVYLLLPHIPVVGGVVSLIGLLLIFGSQQRCLHDRVAGTKVVYS